MITQTLQIVTIFMSYGSDLVVTEDDRSYKLEQIDQEKIEEIEKLKANISYVVVPFEIISYLIWCKIFWNGTRFEVFFSKRNLTLVSCMMVIDFIVHL